MVIILVDALLRSKPSRTAPEVAHKSQSLEGGVSLRNYNPGSTDTTDSSVQILDQKVKEFKEFVFGNLICIINF